ncbi:MAG: ATP-binding protein [Deltaproteobacteria bacterium]|nr:ATP-binding protein [Deltaproteobacteria bacterium]
MTTLTLDKLGPIRHAELPLGDLTVLVGPQASGKSLALQALKAAVDMDAIVEVLKLHGFHFDDGAEALNELVFGEGMGTLVGPDTRIALDGSPVELKALADAAWSKGSRRSPRAFVIPAQRVLTLQEGWPRPFVAWSVEAPFVVRQFSEDLRRLMEDSKGPVFPAPRLTKELRARISDTIFHGASVGVDRSRARKRVVLEVRDQEALPFMSWSAGQREFIPLMLGLYHLMPSAGSSRRQQLEYAILEEPEMGLHPAAIRAVALALMELIRRGYKVIVATHSPHLLELVWALNLLQGSSRFEASLAELLGVGKLTSGLAEAVNKATLRVIAMKHGQEGVVSKDISTLDPDDPDPDVAGWGGLTDFADIAASVVARGVEE